MSLPSLDTRIKIFYKYLNKTRSNISEDFIMKLLQRPELYSGADIEALVNEAIYLSMRRNSDRVEEEDMTKSIK